MWLVSFSVMSDSDPTDCRTAAFPVLQYRLELAQGFVSMEPVMPSNRLILWRPLLLLPSIFPSLGFFSNESVLCTRWLKYWSFSFSINLSTEYLRLISFKID